MSTAEPVSVKQRAINKLRLWFFRDLSSEQRRSLFSIFGMPVNEVKTHGDEAHCLQHVLSALSHVQAPAEPVAYEHYANASAELSYSPQPNEYAQSIGWKARPLYTSPAPHVDEAMVERAMKAAYKEGFAAALVSTTKSFYPSWQRSRTGGKP